MKFSVKYLEPDEMGFEPIFQLHFFEFMHFLSAGSRNDIFKICVQEHIAENEKVRRIAFTQESYRNICRGYSKSQLEDLRLKTTKTLEEAEKTLQTLIDTSYKSVVFNRRFLLVQVILVVLACFYAKPLTLALCVLGLLVEFFATVRIYSRLVASVCFFYYQHGITEAVLKQVDYRSFQKQDYDIDTPIYY